MLGESPRRPKEVPWVDADCVHQKITNKDFMMGVVEHSHDNYLPREVGAVPLNLDNDIMEVYPIDVKVVGSNPGGKKSNVIHLNRKSSPEPHVNTELSQLSFMHSLAMIPCSQCPETPSHKKLSVDVIDLTVDPLPKTPVKPRQKKKSVSMLSGSSSPGAAQRTMFSDNNMDENDTLSNEKSEEEEGEEEEIEEEDDDDKFKLRRINKLLMSVDLTSPLGELVRQHVPEKVLQPQRNSHMEYTNMFMIETVGSKRRDCVSGTSGFPITFKRKRKPEPYCHKYVFNKLDKRDFIIRLATGLTKESRQLKRSMRPCKVMTKNLSKGDIKKMCIVPRLPQQMFHASRPAWPFVGQNAAFFPNLMSQMGMPGMGTMAASLMPDAQAIYAQGQQQRQLQLQRNMAKRYPQCNVMPAVLQQRLLLNQHLMARAAGFGQPASQPGFPLAPYAARGNHRPHSRSGQVRPMRPQRPQPKAMVCDDVIMLSSSEDEDEKSVSRKSGGKQKTRSVISQSRKHPQPPVSNPAPNVDNQAVMFKCHICGAEILFTQSTTMFIREHFSTSHAIHNVQILHNMDQNNQLTFSIVEGPPKPSPPTPKVPTILNKRHRPPGPRNPPPNKQAFPHSSDDVICIDLD